MPRRKPSGPARDPGVESTVARRSCTWETEGRCCLLSATTGERGGLCTWHAIVREDPRHWDRPPVFAEWVEWLRTRGYCVVFTHYPVDWLLAWLSGEEAGDPATPTPCHRTACSIRLHDDPAWADPIPGYRHRPCGACGRAWAERNAGCPWRSRHVLRGSLGLQPTLALPPEG